MKNTKIRTKVVIPILMLLFVGGIVLGVISIFNQTQIVKQNEKNLLGNLNQNFNELINARKIRATALAETIANMSEVQRLFAERDRDGLFNLLNNTYQDLQKNYGVTQGHFHTPPATSFLRLHKPEKFGDDLSGDRQTILKVNAEKIPVSGLESGATGYGIRGVVPINYKGEQVGTFEIGMGFDKTMLEEYKTAYGKETSILILNTNTDVKEKYTYLASTSETPIVVTDRTIDQVIQTGKSQIEFLIKGKIPYAVLLAPIQNYRGDVVAVLEIEHDRSLTLASIYRNIYALVGLIIVILILMAFSVLMIIQKTVTAPIVALMNTSKRIADEDLRTLSFEMDMLAKGDLTREYQVSSNRLNIYSGDEIGQLRTSFNTIIDASNDSANAFSLMSANLNTTLSSFNDKAHLLEEHSKEMVSGVHSTTASTESIFSTIHQVTDALRTQSEFILNTSDVVNQMTNVITDVARGCSRSSRRNPNCIIFDPADD